MDPEPWVERIGELRVESVEVDELPRRDAIEGQSAGRFVQVNPHSSGVGGRGGRGRNDRFVLVVPHGIPITLTPQAAGLVVQANFAVSSPHLPTDGPVGHTDDRFFATPLSLPVMSLLQTLSAQHLGAVVKSFMVVWVRLLLVHSRQCLIPVGQLHLEMGRVFIQCELLGICKHVCR